MTNQSYIRVLTALELFSKEHLQVKRFASDFPEQLPNFSSETEQYPILFVSPTNSIFKRNQNTFELTIYCYDLIQDGRDNINTILSDTNTILNDLYLWLRDGDVGGLDVLNDINCTPINNALLDYVGGWQMNLVIEVDTYNVCEIPFNNVPVITEIINNISYTDYLTCSTLSDCPTIINILNDIEDIQNNTGSITNTSQLNNDGEDGTSVFVEMDELSTVATSGNYNDLLNLPIIPIIPPPVDISGKEDIINKTDIIGSGSSIFYPSTKGIVDYITSTNATWKKSGLVNNANLVNEKIYRQNSVNLIGSTVNFGTGPTQADIDGEVLGSQFGHIFGGGTVPFIQLLGNGANGSAGPNQFISRVVGASKSLQQMTFSTIKSTNYDAWGDVGRLLWRFQDGYLSPQVKFDIGTDYVRLHSYTSSRNDTGDTMNNILFTTSNGSLRSKPVTDTPFVNKFIQVTGVTISSVSWTLNAGFYEYIYSNVNITSNSIVDVIPDNSSYSVVSSGQLLPRVDSFNGEIKIYSNNIPSGDFGVSIIINKN